MPDEAQPVPRRRTTIRAATRRERFNDRVQDAYEWLGTSPWSPLKIPEALGLTDLAGMVRQASDPAPILGTAMDAPPGLRPLGRLVRGEAGVARALETALDLSPEARMQRAAEQGFTTDVLHGRSGDYESVAIPSWKRSSDAGALGEGFYATPATERGAGIADWYASQAGPQENVMPLKLKMERPLVIEGTPGADPRPAAVARLSKEWGLREQPHFSGSKQLNRAWAEEFSQALRAHGYDGVVADLGWAKEYMVLSPQQVRSRFAAFDPAKIGNKNLLASIVGGVALSDLATPKKDRGR